MDGRATFTIEMSRTTMNCPRHTSASTIQVGTTRPEPAGLRPVADGSASIRVLCFMQPSTSVRGARAVDTVANSRSAPRIPSCRHGCDFEHLPRLVPGAQPSWYRQHLAPGPRVAHTGSMVD